MPDAVSDIVSGQPGKVSESFSSYLSGLEKQTSESAKRSEAASAKLETEISMGKAEREKAQANYYTQMADLTKERQDLVKLSDQMKPPPDPKTDDPIKNFGGLATLIGVFGGMLTRQPLVASLNAASAAMNSYHAKNLEEFDQQTKAWKQNSDFISRAFDVRLGAYNAAMHGTEAERAAAFQSIAANTGDSVALANNAHATEESRMRHIETLGSLRAKYDETVARIGETASFHRSEIEHWHAMENAAGKRAGKAQEAKTNELSALGKQVDDVIALVKRNSSVTGAIGAAEWAWNKTGGQVPALTIQDRALFEAKMRQLQTMLQNRFLNSRYFGKSGLERMEELAPGLGIETGPQETITNLEQLKGVIAGQINSGMPEDTGAPDYGSLSDEEIKRQLGIQ